MSYGLLMKDLPADGSVIEALYQCTTCKDCERRCPSKIKVVDVVERARRDLVDAGHMLPRHRKVVDSVRKYGNPYGEERSVPEALGEKPHRARVGYFAGCTSAYRNPIQATLSILKKLGEDTRSLTTPRFGAGAHRAGGDAGRCSAIDAITEQGVERSVLCVAATACSGGVSLARGGTVKVKHISEYLAERPDSSWREDH